MDTLYSIASVNRQPYAKSGYGFLARVLDNLDYGPLVQCLWNYRKRGRRGYDPSSMLRLLLLQYLLGTRTDTELLQRVAATPKLMQLSDLHDVPSNSTFSRFRKRLLGHIDLLDRCRIALLVQLKHFLPRLGRYTAIDSTDVGTYGNGKCKTKKRADQDADWGVKTSNALAGKKEEDFYGYKWHLLADTSGIPLSWTVTAASFSDTTELPVVIKKARTEYKWLKPRAVMADRGYDSLPNHKFLDNLKILPIIHIRKPTAHDGLYDGTYDEKFRPACLGSFMDFIGTDPRTGDHLFQCPTGGCHLKKEDWMPACRDLLRVAPGENLRVIGRVHRGSREWKYLYKQRTSVERVFSTMKLSRKLDSHCLMRFPKVNLHINLSALTYIGTALAHWQAGEGKKQRHMALRVA